jgi:hypothetical protein
VVEFAAPVAAGLVAPVAPVAEIVASLRVRL